MTERPDSAPAWRHFVTIDAAGVVLSVGRQLHDPGQPPPTLALAPGHSMLDITEAEYEIGQRGPCRWEGGELRPYTPEIPLAAVKAAAIDRVDREAELERLRFLTPGTGQALEYRTTLQEAQRLLAGTEASPDPGSYPFLAAEQEAQAALGTTRSLRDIATGILAAEAAWTAGGARIKLLRRLAKLKIEAATSADEVAAAARDIPWRDQ